MIVSPPILIRYQYDIYAQSWGMVKTLASEPDSFKDIVVGKKNLLDIIKYDLKDIVVSKKKLLNIIINLLYDLKDIVVGKCI